MLAENITKFVSRLKMESFLRLATINGQSCWGGAESFCATSSVAEALTWPLTICLAIATVRISPIDIAAITAIAKAGVRNVA